ncbi:MAG TPA: flagellar basal body-associated FliL family protein [Planctomycetaceae bacterium]
MARAALKPAPAAAHQTSQSGQRKSKTTLVIGAVIGGVIAVQIGVTYLLMRSHAPSNSGASHADAATAAPARVTPEHETAEEEIAEISLGEFSFSNTAAVPGIILHVDFKLTALASTRQSSTLESQFRWNQERIREAVNKIVRSSSYDELNEPNLGTLKRLIREELNRVLAKDLINEIVINDIRVLEQ